MAGQSITFDFLTTGADRTASGFRKVGDNTVLAARGAKVLANAIETLGKKEDRTAAESVILAKALRQTGDAEDRVAARAVVADAAIRRLDDAMQDSTKHSGELGKALGGLKLNPGLVGPLLALVPAIATLGGVGAGAAAGLSGAFIAGGAALAAFGAVAKPVLSDAKTAATAVEKAQNAYNTAIASGVAPSKAFKAEQLAISKAYAGMSPAQIALSKQLGDMADAWDKVKAAETPVVSGALQPWLKSVTGLTSALGPVIAKIAPVIASLGGQFNSLVNSSAFKGFRDFIGATGAAAVSAGGSTIIDLVKSFMILLPKFDPLIREAIGWISRLGPAVLSWSSSKKASADIQSFLQWFSRNGQVVGQFLKSIGAALKALAPGLAAGGAAELQIMTAFFTFIAKLPPGLAKPLAEVAGAMLILQKTGVVSVGIKLVGLGAAASGAGAAAGPLAAAGAGIAGGILLGIRHALAAGWKTAVAELPKLLEGVGSILNFSASGWANTILDHFSKPVRQMWADLGHFLVSSFDITRHQVAHAWDVLMNDLAKLFDIFKNLVGIKWDDIKLTFFHGVQYILNIMGKLPGPLGAPFRAAAKDIGNSMAGVEADVRRRTGQIQSDINAIHGKDVTVKVFASGGGGMTFTQKVAQSISSGGFSLHSLAGGGLVRMGSGPTADDVPAMLSRGELVVPAHMVKAGAADNLRGKIPGFAGGGLAGMVPWAANAETGFAQAAEASLLRAEFANLKKVVGAAAKAAAITSSKVPNVGSGVARWRGLVVKALGMEGLSQQLVDAVLYQMQTESGGNPNAINLTDINAQRGDPSRGLMQTIGATFRAYHWPGTSNNIYDPLANIAAALNYARHNYGPGLRNAYGGIGTGRGYALGGLVPGYASGGTVAQQGQTFLNAWRSRRGGPYALATGPQTLTQQIPAMQAAIGRATTLSRAGGLTAGQHKFWAGTAAGEKRLLATLKKEMTTEKAWSGQLTGTDATLAREIAAAGTLPQLAGNVKAWKSQIAAHLHTIGDIRGMIGAAAAPGTPGGPVLPAITHTYGGDVANNLGAVLQAALGPFTGAARGGLVMDSGGTLRPGFNPVWNMTGRPEPLVPARSGGGKLQIEWVGGEHGGDELTRWIRKNVVVRGGGNVQKAFGAH